MKQQCIIVDDEKTARNILKKYIADVSYLKLIGEFKNAIDALEFIQVNQIDLIFLDIEMPKISGLTFLKTISNPPATILTTAYREFALEGYELNVIDYLLKPFSFERFLKAVTKVEANNNTAQRINNETIKNRPFEYFKADRKNVKVYYDDILYIEGLSNYVKIHFNNECLIVYLKLIDLEKTLPKKQFARIHKSYIISLTKIKAYGNDYVEIAEKQFSIGNTYRETFFKVLNLKDGLI